MDYLDKIQEYKKGLKDSTKKQQSSAELKSVANSIVKAVTVTGKKTIDTVSSKNTATAEDIDKVIAQLKEVQLAQLMGNGKSTVVLADSTDLGEAMSGLRTDITACLEALKQDNSSAELVAKVEEKFSALVASFDTHVEAVKDMIDGANNTEAIIEALQSFKLDPVIQVAPPQVQVDVPATDLSSLDRRLDKLDKTLAKIKMPQIDLSGVTSSNNAVRDAISNLRIPVPNFIQDPFIRYKAVDEYDDGVETSVKYYGFLSPEGHWYVMEYDPSGSAKTMRYAFGDSNYETNWTNRTSLTYDLPFGR